jgi:divalent metal cation (Fe/Co/Zn/Cd) transporter
MIENAQSLSSKTAPPEFLAKLTYLVWNHSSAILKIDTVRAYTLGNFYFAEVDIVLPKDMRLNEAHDIGESLQNKLETLPEIERAFVHLDYVSHVDEHLGHPDY